MRYVPKITLIILGLVLINYKFGNCGTLLKEEAQDYRKQGLSAQKKGNFSRALEYYQKAISLDPENAAVYNDLGIAYESQGKFAEAEDMYLRSISINPNILAPYFNLGILYEKRQDYEKAGYYFKKRYELGFSDDPWAIQSLEHLRQMSEVSEPVHELYLKLEAASLMREFKRTKSGQLKLESSQDDSSLANTYFEKARKLYKKKDYIHALKELNKAYALEPKNKAVEDLMQRAQINILINQNK